jgi:hypothetical protein
MKNINYISDLRKRKLWTQEKLADESGLSVRTIQRIESGEDVSLETIRVIAQALGVEISDLFEQIIDTDKKIEITNLSEEQENQIKKRAFENKIFILFRFIFVFFMIFIGNQLTYFSKDFVLIILWILWFMFWPVGFIFLSYLRIFWWDIKLDGKYPLTKGINVRKK